MIKVRELTKRYGPAVAVDRLSFEVRPGAVTGFLGPNGAGKSTTMRMILGLDMPDEGTALVNGMRYRDLRGVAGARARSRSACRSGSASRPRCSATPACCCSIGRLDRRLRDRAGWRAVAYAVLRMPAAALELYSAFVFLDGLVNLGYPLVWLLFRNHPAGTRLGPLDGLAPVPFGNFKIWTWPGTIPAALLGAGRVLAAPWLARAAVAGDRHLIRTLLGPAAMAERVRQLEQTRALAVDDSAAALRRVERDLHDGAQVRLAALALSLGMARDKADAGEPDMDAIRELLDAAQGNAAGALAELRDLARGIHPPALDNGLPDALASLAAASAIPVLVRACVPERPTPAIETIAYFCAAELVANATKHSYANKIEINVQNSGGQALRLAVAGDGVARSGVAALTPRERGPLASQGR